MIGRRRITAVVLAVGLLVAGCSGDAVLDEPSDSFCQGGSLYGLIRRVEAIVEVEGIVDSGRRVTRMEEQHSVFEARLVEVVHQDRWLVPPLVDDGTIEFIDLGSPDHGETGRVYLFLVAAAADVSGFDGYSVRLAGVDDGEMLNLLGSWDRCHGEGVAEFAGRVDWSLIEAHDGLPEGSDELRLLTAWVLEIANTKQPRKNGPITKAWLGTAIVDVFGCQSAPAEELPDRPPFELRLDPGQVEAGGTASLEIGVMKPDDLAGWGGRWECWTGTEWVATHQIEHGRRDTMPGAALEVVPGTITTMPAIGYRIPETFTITIPDVPPGWYRLREGIASRGGMVVGYIAVEVVAAIAAPAEESTTTTTTFDAGLRLPPYEEAAIALPCRVAEGDGPQWIVDPIPLGGWFGAAHTAIVFDGTWFAGLDEPQTETSVPPPGGPPRTYYKIGMKGDVTASAGTTPRVIRMPPERFDVLQEFGPGRTIVLAVGGKKNTVELIAIVDPAGGVAFEGECGAWYTDDFAAFRASQPELATADPIELLTGLFHDDSPERAAYIAWAQGR